MSGMDWRGLGPTVTQGTGCRMIHKLLSTSYGTYGLFGCSSRTETDVVHELDTNFAVSDIHHFPSQPIDQESS